MIRVGIFMGGASREREISFAGGRTVYDLLDKNLFEPVPLFVDSLGNIVELNWPNIYKGTIRDFYPPVGATPFTDWPYPVYVESLGPLPPEQLQKLLLQIGKPVTLSQLAQFIDLAFLALHGTDGEDGSIQGLLQWLQIPYTGSGIVPAGLGMDKTMQKQLMKAAGWDVPQSMIIDRKAWMEKPDRSWYAQAADQIGIPLVIRPANQGSSIGVSILKHKKQNAFRQAVEKALFIQTISYDLWRAQQLNLTAWLQQLSEVKDGVGIPFRVGNTILYHPKQVIDALQRHFHATKDPVLLESIYEEQQVVVEEFIDGLEFSCIVIRNENGKPLALPPTEIRKAGSHYDYRSKYLSGISRKVTPASLPARQIERIRRHCEELFEFFGFHVYARIDGFLRKKDGRIFLNDPNTTSGMLPSSFFFHQAAEIGLNPTQFLTYIIRTSLQERSRSPLAVRAKPLLHALDQAMEKNRKAVTEKKRVAVVFGGHSSERHISVESGRNVFEKLASSQPYQPIPVFLMPDTQQSYKLVQLPIHLMLKDNADDIHDAVVHYAPHPVVEKIKKQAQPITQRFAAPDYTFEPKPTSWHQLRQQVDFVFLALHGRPGEDGTVQADLERIDLPYNGSDSATSQLAIDKYATNECLKNHGIRTPRHALFYRDHWLRAPQQFYQSIEQTFPYPLIAKPVDDGCSTAVKRITNRQQLEAYCHLLFRENRHRNGRWQKLLQLKPNEEFPAKNKLLVEEWVQANGAVRFLEITGGLLTHYHPDGNISYEVFEPSEIIAQGDVLSLEEKFLAGEGQNLTPARFAEDEQENQRIAAVVKSDLERVAKTLHIYGYCRIDAFVRIYPKNRVETIVLEVNTLPGLTPATCLFHQAALHNYKPFDFLNAIIRNGCAKVQR